MSRILVGPVISRFLQFRIRTYFLWMKSFKFCLLSDLWTTKSVIFLQIEIKWENWWGKLKVRILINKDLFTLFTVFFNLEVKTLDIQNDLLDHFFILTIFFFQNKNYFIKNSKIKSITSLHKLIQLIFLILKYHIKHLITEGINNSQLNIIRSLRSKQINFI